ncbi:penicillin-binding protein 2 [Sulfurimonas sp. HSL-3221]|uniref:penicillin-binding protein 2 n=1 Tax=Sulfurimonadaceae TaxID=2771471 RepID=UPI001E503636|nr:penicillin-binding protein 2 [Sulfurimonas sp. HSL-3221]UFS61323.1 penicillin-binding protein 2 [Sulfurimonas sp. HSL-3221]
MRTRFLIALFIFIWVSLLSRVYYLSVHSNRYYEQLSTENTLKTERIAPVRGEILDRNFKPLAINKLGFKIEIMPHLNTQKRLESLQTTLERIQTLLPMLDAQKMIKIYKQNDSHYNHREIAVADFISYEDILPVYSELNLLENVKISPAPMRYYPYQKIAAHLIGYTAKSNQQEIEKDPVLKLTGIVGKSGLEKQYNRYLEGVPGERTVQMNALNEEISVLETRKAVENRNLVLTIDMRLQQYISELMRGNAGAVIVMGLDGEILSAGSYPEYNPNTFVSGISAKKWNALINDLDMPFTNKIVNGLYPPGSTIKPSIGLVYLDSGISQWWYVTCSGTMKLGNRNFRCWKSWGHGKTDLHKAIRESCDDYFYKGSLKVGIEKISEGLKNFGLGNKTDIDLPNEFIGTIPNRAWKRERYNEPWYIGETLNTSIGQGSVLVTPLQIAQNTALLAGGKLPRPRLARMIDNNLTKAVYRDVLTPAQKADLPIIRRAMRQVCSHPKGTASSQIKTTVPIAGKTGTAQVVGIPQATKKRIKEEDMAYYTRSHAWLTTYGPYKHPKYVVTALIEHGGHGASAAGDIVSKIYDKLVEFGYIKK